MCAVSALSMASRVSLPLLRESRVRGAILLLMPSCLFFVQCGRRERGRSRRGASCLQNNMLHSCKPFWLKPFWLKAISSKTECENLVSPPLDGLIRWESVEWRTRNM